MRKPKTRRTVVLPASHLALMQERGFEAMWYRDNSIKVRVGEEERVEWLPGDLVNWEKRQFVRFDRAGEGSLAYDTDGYFPSQGHHHGGCHSTVAGALGWFDFLNKQLGSVA